MENIKDAQNEMSKNYANGSTGIIISGIVWLISALIIVFASPKSGVWSLLIGGALIFPLSLLVNKLIGLSDSHSKDNPLGKLAMEGTFLMLMCIPIALLLSLQNIEWFFQAMLMIIGGRYLTFQTLYGNKLYWLLGSLLGISAFILFSLKADAFTSVLTGAIIEIVFGSYMFFNFKKTQTKQH